MVDQQGVSNIGGSESGSARLVPPHDSRREIDEVRVRSDVFEGKTTCASINPLIENADQCQRNYWRNVAFKSD